MKKPDHTLHPWAGRIVSAGLLLAAIGGVAASDGRPAVAAGEFAPLDAPKRIADTRPTGETIDDEFAGTGPLAAETELELQVAGRAGVPNGASAAVLNVTVTDAEGPGFFTVYPCDQPRPNSSNLNYVPGQVVANAVFAGLDGMGKTCIFSKAKANVIADVTGSFPAGAFEPLDAPQRIADTRPTGVTVDGKNQASGPVGPEAALQVKVRGRAGVPGGAETAVLNVTVTDPENPGFFTVYPCDQQRPTASNLNYLPGAVVANSAVAKLDAQGNVCVFSKARANVIVDVAGTLPDSTFVPLAAPLRLVDSRPGQTTTDSDVAGDGYRRAGSTLQFPVAGRGGIPTGASAVVFNVTVTQPTSPGFLTLHPRGSDRPQASNLNYAPGDTVANTVVAPVGEGGMVCLFSKADTEAIVDVAGYFLGTPPADTGRNCPMEFAPGTHPVGKYQMPAGRYVSENGANSVCEFYRWNEETFSGGQLGSVLVFGEGRLLADVRPTDPFVNFRFDGCNPLVPYEPPGPPFNPASSFGVGSFVVNQHILPGTYQAVRPFGSVCTGIRLSSFDGAKSSQIERFDDNQAAVVTLKVLASDVGFFSGCDNFVRIGD
jgi:hypothetical protein